MKEGLAYLPTALALVLSLVLVPVLTLAMTPVDPAGPVVVVTAPSANPVHIIEASGGSVIGLENAPMGTLGFSAVPGFEEKLKANGAWAVLDGRVLAGLCGVEI